MTIHYRLLLAATAASLASCSSNSNRPDEADRPAAPTAQRAAADTLAVPATSAATAGSPANPAAPQVAISAPSAKVKLPAFMLHTLGAIQIGRRLGARKKPLTNAVQADSASNADATTGGGTRETPILPDQEGLAGFLASGLPTAQEFVVKPGRDTVLLGAQGTQILVPAAAWDVPLGSGPVRVQLREFYSIADMVLAGLGTTADGQLLETGGMLNLTASTETGQPVVVRPGAALRLRLPTKEVKPDMQQYVGRHTEAGLDWQLDTMLLTQAVDPGLLAARLKQRRFSGFGRHRFRYQNLQQDTWPEYLTSTERRQARELRTQTQYPTALLAQLRRGGRRTAAERNVVNTYNKKVAFEGDRHPRIRRAAAVAFTVDTSGATTNVKLRPGYDARLAAPVLEAMQSWQQWRPAHLPRAEQSWRQGPLARLPQTENRVLTKEEFARHKSIAMGMVWVMLTMDNKIILTKPIWDVAGTANLQRNKQAATILAAYRAKVAAASVSSESARRDGGASAPVAASTAPTADDLYYELNSAGIVSQTQWLNCDRPVPLSPAQPLLVYRMDDSAPDAQFMFVLRKTRSLVQGARAATQQKVLFRSIPYGTDGTLVAMRWKNGQALLATYATTLSNKPLQPSLNYRPVTMLELQQELAKLE